MEQLLSIKRIPIKVEVNVTRAELRPVEDNGIVSAPSLPSPSVQVSSGRDGFVTLTAEPYRVDLSENRNFDSYIPSGNGGFTLTYEAVAKFADSKQAGGANQTAQKKQPGSVEAVLQSLPKNKHQNPVSYSNGTLSVNYQMNRLQRAETSSADEPTKFEFIPGNIEVIIKQMPGLEIEYLGDPIYFPRSADPNYEPLVDVTV